MKVHEIFRSIQGEGKLTGTPMTFIRLYGCNLQCPWCDQPQEPGGYTEMSVEDIVKKVGDKWVCITGGEPTIHKDLPCLVITLQNEWHEVAIETNGTSEVPYYVDWLCVSPKDPWPNHDVLWHADEIKLLVGSGMYDAAEKICDLQFLHSSCYSRWISLMPVWDNNYKKNLKEAIRLCQKYQVRLSIQLHKYLGVR